jgi:isocitrate dehydrogenase kinase/phosphatase
MKLDEQKQVNKSAMAAKIRTPRPALLEQHADLFHPDFWRNVQRKLREGETPEVFPYRPERRLVTAN